MFPGQSRLVVKIAKSGNTINDEDDPFSSAGTEIHWT